MRKIYLIASFAVFIMLTSGCGHIPANLMFSFDTNGNYAGFKTLPENYTPEQAIKDGCYVTKNLEEIGGGNAWEEFFENSVNGKDSCIRIMSIYDSVTYYEDVFYVEENYRIFDSASEDMTDHKYKYILDLRGRTPNAVKDSRYVVLTDDETLTFEDVSLTFYSSNSEIINAISPFKIVSGMAL